MDLKELESCRVCPRECRADRLAGETGICGVAGKDVYIARAALHFWEEPCISGKNGSGTVFFSGCSLHCIYCQNGQISGGIAGRAVSVTELAEIFLTLQDEGAENINLVTPTHYAVQIREALLLAKEKGLRIPVVYNTGGYERTETLKKLAGLIDIYLTDYKYADGALADRFSNAPDYPETAMRALHEMVRQQPECLLDERGMMKKGVIVRHLLLPGHVKNAKETIQRLYEAFGDRIYFAS